jgi:hypothetical protein
MSLAKRFLYSGYSNSGLDFIIRIDTTITGTGTVTATNQYQIATLVLGAYQLTAIQGTTTVDFGVLNGGGHILTFPTTGIWDLRFTPTILNPLRTWNQSNAGDRNKLIQIRQWGKVVWIGMSFRGCQNMDVVAEDTPIFSGSISGVNLFLNCNNLVNANGSISNWNTTNFTGLIAGFRDTTIFNKSLNNWNTENIADLSTCFLGAAGYNLPLDNWDVSKVTTFSQMFFVNNNFNQNLGSWNLRLAGTNLSQIFRGANAMSTANYTDTFVGWANYVFENGAPFNVDASTQTGRTFDTSRSGGANFANAGAARTYLTTTAGWTISGDTVI